MGLIGRYVDLEPRRGVWMGRCPFHGGQHKSLAVSPEKKLFHCYDCHLGGTPEEFLNLAQLRNLSPLVRDPYGPMKYVLSEPLREFETFVTDESNSVVRIAVETLVRDPSWTQPVVLESAPGLGKTHLLEAAGREYLRQRPQARIQNFRAESFLNDLALAWRTHQIEAFRNLYRHPADLVLFDDLSFLEGKEAVTEELAYTVQALYENGTKLLFATAKPIQQLQLTEKFKYWLLSRSLSLSIEEPKPKARREYVTRAAHQRGWKDESLTDKVLALPLSTFRELEARVLLIELHLQLGRDLNPLLK